MRIGPAQTARADPQQEHNQDPGPNPEQGAVLASWSAAMAEVGTAESSR